MARKTQSGEPKDLLGYIKPRGTIGDADQYLKASDFYVSPDLNNEDFYPSRNQPLKVGESPSRYFGGGIPIFVGEGSVFPSAVVAKRQRAMDQAALNAKLYNQKVDANAQKSLEDLYKMPGDVNYMYDEDLKKETINGYRSIYQEALTAHGGNKLAAINDLRDPNSFHGKKLQDHMVNQKIWENTINQITDISAKMHVAQEEHNAYIPPALESAVKEFETGNLRKANTQDLKKTIFSMHAMHDVIPFYNQLLNSVDPSETFGSGKEKGYTVTQVNKDDAYSRALMQIQAQPQIKMGYAMSVGLPPSATDEQVASAMAENIVKQKGRTIQKIPADAAGSGDGDGKYIRFVSRPITENSTSTYHHAGGYEIQDITASENSPTEKVKYSQFFDPQTGKIEHKSGEVQGAITRIELVYNPETKKVEWMTNVSVPSHNETVEKTATDDKGRKVTYPETISVPGKSIMIPYNETSAKVEAYTVDRRGNNGFKLKKEDFDKADQINSKINKGSLSVAPKDGDERAVQGGTAIFKNGKWQMK